MGQVTFYINNWPAEAIDMTVRICDWNITTLLVSAVGVPLDSVIDLGEVDDSLFPLRFDMLRLDIPDGADYIIQSCHPTLWDWDLGDYGDEPDPSYREIFIDGPGEWEYSISTETLTKRGGFNAAFWLLSGSLIGVGAYMVNRARKEFVR